MNKRDAQVIAGELADAWRKVGRQQTAATAWYVAVGAVADALSKCSTDFDKDAFVAACRVVKPLTPLDFAED